MAKQPSKQVFVPTIGDGQVAECRRCGKEIKQLDAKCPNCKSWAVIRVTQSNGTAVLVRNDDGSAYP